MESILSKGLIASSKLSCAKVFQKGARVQRTAGCSTSVTSFAQITNAADYFAQLDVEPVQAPRQLAHGWRHFAGRQGPIKRCELAKAHEGALQLTHELAAQALLLAGKPSGYRAIWYGHCNFLHGNTVPVDRRAEFGVRAGTADKLQTETLITYGETNSFAAVSAAPEPPPFPAVCLPPLRQCTVLRFELRQVQALH
jgi:hypothetical protein